MRRFGTMSIHWPRVVMLAFVCLMPAGPERGPRVAAAAPPRPAAEDPMTTPSYQWLDATRLDVPEDWNTGAWYRKSAAPGVRYDLDAPAPASPLTPAPGWAIVLPDGAGQTERFAARELRKYLGRITGVAIEITSAPPAAGATIMRVGNRLDPRLAGRPDDEYVVATRPGALILSGAGGRGTLYAVYDFLENRLGCRWFYPDPGDEVVPRAPLARVAAALAQGIDAYRRPAMPYRDMVILCSDPCRSDPGVVAWETMIRPESESEWLRNQLVMAARQIDWMAKNRYNVVMTEGSAGGIHILPENWDLVRSIVPEVKKRGLLLGLGGHFWTPFLNDETPGWPANDHWGTFWQGKRHRVRQWSRTYFCTTNPEAMTAFLRHVVAFSRANPEFDIWSAWPPDGGGPSWCECPVCAQFSVSLRAVKFYCQVAEALEPAAARPASPIRGKRIPSILLGYGGCAAPPAEDLALHPLFAVMPDIYRKFHDPFPKGPTAWRVWLDAHGRDNPLYLFGRWTRCILTGYHLLPQPSLTQTVRNLVDSGFTGVENFHGGGGWWVKALGQYATARALWDPKLDLGPFEADYFARYYGPSAVPMKAFYDANETAHEAAGGNWGYMDNYDNMYRYVDFACGGADPG
ncbi:MAG: DUF4838 domain-containing protein, partial [bacterium]|nr:DUF4838 domain-containing protein [bacterium]